ncbi:DUF4401 domain-containing protein [Flexithrix dorotheae]|uniref:DUF4401 domain-containing protein n=1 Tax=Flexithrix dorotheae TaxID=70993 RepID=UPI00035CFFD3|nr:DUF4401 domain-containing protein [Flexithrix dorotheae]
MENNLTIKKMTDSLQEEGIETGFTEKEDFLDTLGEEKDVGGWSVKIFSIIGAWIGACLFMGFLFLVQLFESTSGLFLVGLSLTISAVIGSHKFRKSIFLEPFTLAMGIIGQILIIAGVGTSELFSGSQWHYLFWAGVLVEAIIFYFTLNPLQKFLSLLLINIFLLSFFGIEKLYEVVHFIVGILAMSFTFLWLYEIDILKKHKLAFQNYFPVLYAIMTSLIVILAFTVNKDWYSEIAEVNLWWISSIFLIACCLYTVHHILKHFQLNRHYYLILGLSIALLLPSFIAPGLAASLLILLIGFYKGHKITLGLGLLCLIYFMSAFYYNLNTTLLIKSSLLFTSGVLFFSGRYILNYIFRVEGI